MRKFFAVAMGSVMALAGFAGTASASATVDLVWIDISNVDTGGNPICLRPAQRNCPQLGTTLSSVVVTDNITLGVLITAGPEGVLAAGVGVNYTDALPKLSVAAFRSVTTTKPGPYLPTFLEQPNNDTSGWVDGIQAIAIPLSNQGIGLPPGQTAYLGTVTFHKDVLQSGTSELIVSAFGPNNTGAIINLATVDNDVTLSSTFNSAFLVNAPEPGALSLLVMGLGGMLLAGRGRTS